MLYLGHFRNVKSPDWLLKLEKDFDWLANGKWLCFFFFFDWLQVFC